MVNDNIKLTAKQKISDTATPLTIPISAPKNLFKPPTILKENIVFINFASIFTKNKKTNIKTAESISDNNFTTGGFTTLFEIELAKTDSPF